MYFALTWMLFTPVTGTVVATGRSDVPPQRDGTGTLTPADVRYEVVFEYGAGHTCHHSFQVIRDGMQGTDPHVGDRHRLFVSLIPDVVCTPGFATESTIIVVVAHVVGAVIFGSSIGFCVYRWCRRTVSERV